MGQLRFQRMKEGFHVRVLTRRTPARHALTRPARGQSVAHRHPEEFAAAIAVKDQTATGLLAADRRIQDGTGEPRVARPREAPRQHSPRVLVEHEDEVPPAPGGPEIRQVAHPDAIRSTRLSPAHAIRMLAEPPMRAGGPPIHLHRTRSPAAHPHQPFHASAADVVATRGQGLVEPWAPVRPVTGLEDRTHLSEEHPVLSRVRARRSDPPGVIPRPRDAEQPTEPRHAEPLPFLVDERERVGFRAEVNRMSFFRSACSSCRSVCARCKV